MTTTQEPAPVSDAHAPAPRERLLFPILLPVGILAVIGAVLFGFSRILLSVSHNAATAVALIVAATIMAVASFVASRPSVSTGSLFSLVGSVGAVGLLAGGVALLAIGPEKEEPEAPALAVVSITAPEGAASKGFDPSELQVPSGETFEIAFDNKDAGVQHNVEIFAEDPAASPGATPLFSGSLVTGAAEATYTVGTPLEEGSYFFNCVVHPTTMTGTIQAKPGAGSLTVRAKGLKFDTDVLNLPPDSPTTIQFDNQDAGTQHNIAIYRDEAATDPVWQGEIVTGPTQVTYDVPAIEAGDYFFHCDVHPTMSGTVVVGAPPKQTGSGGGAASGGGSGGGDGGNADGGGGGSG